MGFNMQVATFAAQGVRWSQDLPGSRVIGKESLNQERLHQEAETRDIFVAGKMDWTKQVLVKNKFVASAIGRQLTGLQQV